jgi:biotin carboxylase
MNVVFLSPNYPPEMQQFTRGLAEVGATVWGVGDSHRGDLAPIVKSSLSDYCQVPRIMDEDDVARRLDAWLKGRTVDRIETNWEPLTLMAAGLRERYGVPGMSRDAVVGFRDKVEMRDRLAAAGIRIPKTFRVRSTREAWAAAEQIGWPVIFKPVAGAGSADTWRAGSPKEFEAALKSTAHVPEASVEEFVTGAEYTFETIAINGDPVVESATRYYPNVLEARKNEWISPIILSLRDMALPELQGGIAMGRKVLKALGMGTGFTHMEWYLTPAGEAVFGEIACRSPGACMVDLMNFTSDADLFREWARIVCWHAYEGPTDRKYNAGIVFKRAIGQGRIKHIDGLDAFRRRHGAHIAREDFLPIGAHRRDWTQTFLSDGHIVVRHTDHDRALDMAREATTQITLYAG